MDRTEGNGYWMFVVAVQLLDCWNPDNNKAEPINPPRTETAYLMLQGQDGPNQTQIDAIQGFAPEWVNTNELKTLHGLNLRGRAVSVVTSPEEYKGKVSERIQFVNAPGGLKSTAKDVVDAMGEGWQTRRAPVKPKEAAAAAVSREPNEV